MKYGFIRKLTSWKYWLKVILIQLLVKIVLEFIFIRIFEDEPQTPVGFFLWLVINVFTVVVVSGIIEALLYKWNRRLFDDYVSFDEVEKEVKKNKGLWSKIEPINGLCGFNDDYQEYPILRKELVEYKKNHKLKLYERDYVCWVLNLKDGNFEEWKKEVRIDVL